MATARKRPAQPKGTGQALASSMPRQVQAFTQKLFEKKGGPNDALARVHAAYLDNQKRRPKVGV